MASTNPYCLHFAGYKETIVNLSSRSDTMQGIYHRITYQKERLDKKLSDYKSRWAYQNHHRKEDLKSYTKHYDKFIEYKNLLLKKFSEDDIEKEMEKSRERGWRKEMGSWDSVLSPQQVAKLPVYEHGTPDSD